MTTHLTPTEHHTAGDLEVCRTNYPHPTITEGMHTNGPAATWVRIVGGEWICVDRMPMHRVREYWTVFGEEWLASLLKNKAE